MRRSGALFHTALFVAVSGTDDAALGVLDEIQDDVPFLGLGESGLDLGAGVGDIVALEIEDVVDVLDVADGIGGEAPSAQADYVDAAVAYGLASADGERRNVLIQAGASADHRVGADLGELVDEGAAAEDGPVVEVGLACYSGVAHQDAVLADVAVVGDVHVGHHEGVVANLCHALAAGLGPAVDGGALTDGDVVLISLALNPTFTRFLHI